MTFLPGLGATVFTANNNVPPGVCIVCKGDLVVWFGPLRSLPLDEMPPQARINVHTRDYDRIAAAAKKADPNAPEIITTESGKR